MLSKIEKLSKFLEYNEFTHKLHRDNDVVTFDVEDSELKLAGFVLYSDFKSHNLDIFTLVLVLLDDLSDERKHGIESMINQFNLRCPFGNLEYRDSSQKIVFKIGFESNFTEDYKKFQSYIFYAKNFIKKFLHNDI